MKTKNLRAVFGLLILAGGGIALFGCNETPPDSLYDPSWTSNARPVVASYTTLWPNLAGVTIFTFSGSNFSSAPVDNVVFFNATPGTVLSAAPTQLKVRVPYLIKDTVFIRMAVRGSSMFSDPPIQYKLEQPDVNFGLWKTKDETYGLAIDASGGVYASTLSGGIGIGVKRYNGDGTRDDYSLPPSSTIPRYNNMKFGPGGYLYVCARYILWRIPPGGGTAATYLAVTGAANATDIDFDANNNIWVVGTGNSNIYRIRTSDKNLKAFPCAGDMRAVRVYSGYVYVGGMRDSLEKVFRFPIVTPDSLGAEEEYFNLTSVYGVNGGGIYAMTFNTDGDMYLGTDNPEGIRLVHADRTSEPMFVGVLLPKVISFAWSPTGSWLFFSRTGGVLANGTSVTNALMKVNTQRTGAPTYGR
jgi:hypothetical protein